MKCCFLKRKDLNFHYKKMDKRFYMLNGYNDEQITATRRPLSNITLGEIHQMALKQFDRICQKPHLKIKCKADKCSCSTKKRKHFLPKEGRKNCRFRYFRKKQRKGF
ncbi:hypothetical protein ACOSQ2_027503 [Xanthoceras sorbifolium]